MDGGKLPTNDLITAATELENLKAKLDERVMRQLELEETV